MECQFVAQENARRHENLYPMAAETVLKSTYMDDFIDSVETEEEGIELYRQLDALWSLAGMQARKWISNSPKVIAATSEEDRATQLNVSDGQGPVIKALGLSWESKDDVLSISTADVPPDLPLTKRNVLRQIASVRVRSTRTCEPVRCHRKDSPPRIVDKGLRLGRRNPRRDW